ncbi:MAG: hypothetical protein ACW98U_03165 [Candidatus Thorarchaeota archaeon]|jgi:hypothetical protein
MERAKKPHLIEQAEQLLRRYCDKLDLDSISLIKEDGTFLYSSDPKITQQNDTESIFEVLDIVVYAYPIGAPYGIFVQDLERCLFVKPVYHDCGNFEWGVAYAWIFALGRSSGMGFGEYLNQLELEEPPSYEDYDKNMKVLNGTSNLPKVIGAQSEFDDDLTITILGEHGGRIFTPDNLPQRFDVSNGYYSQFWREIDELDDDIMMSRIGVFVPKPEKEPEIDLTKLDYSKSNNLLLIALVYSAILMLPAAVEMTLIYAAHALIIMITDLMLVFFVHMSRLENPIRIQWICPSLFFLIGMGLIFVGIDGLFGYKDVLMAYWFFVSLYMFLIVATLVVNVQEQGRFGGKLTDPPLIPATPEFETPEQVSPPIFQEEHHIEDETTWKTRYTWTLRVLLFIILYSIAQIVLSPNLVILYAFGDVFALMLLGSLAMISSETHNEWICTMLFPCILFGIGLSLIFLTIFGYMESILYSTIEQISGWIYILLIAFLMVINAWELGKLS